MKKLLLLFLLLPLLSEAQNWHSVPVGQHNIYRVSVPQTANPNWDYAWDNYIRSMYVRSTITGFNGTRYNFYFSQRKNSNEMLDSATGPTWLGRFNFRENNGTEFFLNKYLDTIRINTLGQLNDNWVLGMDTSGQKRFEATIVAVDTLTIDGIVDSIKKIDIQAFIGFNPVTSIYNNYQIVLSKSHGLYQALDFYGFPNYESAESNLNINVITDSNATIYPALPYLHTRLDSTIIHTKYDKSDPFYQYQAGNDWIKQTNAPNIYNTAVSYDSIISVNALSPNTLEVTKKVVSKYTLPPVGGPAQNVFSSTVVIDTVSTFLGTKKLIVDTFENWRPGGTPHGYYWDYHFVKNYCTNKLLIIDTSGYVSLLSGSVKKSDYYFEDLDIKINILDYLPGQPGGYYVSNQFDYYNFNGCTSGSYYPLRPHAVNNFYDQSNLFKVYPNPSHEQFYIQSGLDWQSVQVINLQGKLLKSFGFEQQQEMNIADLPHGLYLIKIATKEGNYIYKLLKE